MDPQVQIDPPASTTTPETDAYVVPDAEPEPAPAPFQIQLESGSPALSTHQILLRAGVDNTALDLGCNPESEEGRSDRVIEACEVREFSLTHYLEYPEAALVTYGGSVPWALGSDLQKRVDEALQRLRDSKSLPGLNEDSSQRKLALGLFYFIDFPRETNFSKREEEQLRLRTATLRAEGLGDFQAYLFEHGGLGASTLRPASMKRISTASADEVFKGQGVERNEWSLVQLLYAVFDHAELKPELYTVPMQYSHPVHDEWEYESPRSTLHVSFLPVIGIPESDGVHYLNPITMDADVHYSETILRNRSYHAGLYLVVSGHEAQAAGRYQEALAYFQRSLQFTPQAATTYHSMGRVLEKLGKADEAKAAYEKSVELDPEYGRALISLGDILWEQGDKEKAVRFYRTAVEKDPDKIESDTAQRLIQRGREYSRLVARGRIKPSQDLFDEGDELVELALNHLKSRN